MLLKLDLANTIYFSSVIVGTVTGAILLVYSMTRNKSNIPLALAFLSLSFAIFLALLINSGLMADFPGLYRTGNIFALIFIPMPFLYVLNITQNRTLKWYDAFHFIPSLIYLIDFWPVLMLSQDEKLTLIIAEINDPNQFIGFNQSRFFPKGFHLIFRTAWVNVYWILQIAALVYWQKGLKRAQNRFEKDWKSWIIFFLVLEFFLFFPYYLTFFWLESSLAFIFIHSSASILLFSSAVLLYFYPKLLYGLNEVKFVTDQILPAKEIEVAGIPDPSQEIKMKELGMLITNWIEEKEVYLKHGYSIQDFARDTQIPYYQISACINRSLDSTFADLLNKKRIDYSMRMLQNGIFSNYTLEALSKECGFNNRNSFLAAFKKFTGTTPSDFKKNLPSKVVLN
ncbi:AraC family transcriptional regulator [Aquiflexum sp. TKW24L]|uniref:helix-turn-helix domain-containing protein n=1 Tax=Aquiflexum sp. TKW24L TaxID=2942212 RepID=UPI0020BD5B14|nr:AraC family transcriptional regulator [Aquiflexum sp. TKW24L]MCL6259822.1 AraC family transcriptional regulator [Aquiflexum sp. TKW24L]